MCSTEPHENSYGVMKNGLRKGTRNTPFQLLKNYYLRDNGFHRCIHSVPIHIAAVGDESRSQEDNTIITTRNGLNTEYWRVQECSEDSLIVTAIQTEPYVTKEELNLNLPWSAVGIQKYIAETKKRRSLPISDVSGKGVLVKNVLSEYQTVWLQSKRSV
jgi:predicted HTH transcriptional regulator